MVVRQTLHSSPMVFFSKQMAPIHNIRLGSMLIAPTTTRKLYGKSSLCAVDTFTNESLDKGL